MDGMRSVGDQRAVDGADRGADGERAEATARHRHSRIGAARRPTTLHTANVRSDRDVDLAGEDDERRADARR